MKIKTIFLLGLLVFPNSFTAVAQRRAAGIKGYLKKDSASLSLLKPQKSVTQDSVTVEGNKINYKAVAGTLILKNKDNKPTCSIFYVAYFKDDISDESQRPVTFIYNGGPGSSSLWLHIGAWGPRRVMLKETSRFLPPYKMVNNDYSLLDASDLVFIDAPGTGFSRIITKKKGGNGDPKVFYSIDGDAQAFTQFITNFLSTYNRWDSPKYLFGESYGTLRSAVVSNILETEDGIDLNGVIMLSQALTYRLGEGGVLHPGDNLSYALALPSEAATAWYFHKIPDRKDSLKYFLKEVKHFALNDYILALLKGSLLDTATFNQIAEKLHNYTGLPIEYIHKANLRIGLDRFRKNLLTNEGRILGAHDARFTGPELDPLSEYPIFNPTLSTISSAFISNFNNCLRKNLKFGKGLTYHPFGGGVSQQWDFRAKYMGKGPKLFTNVLSDLASAMTYNPKLKVMLNMGYFDLVTPYCDGLYEMHQLPMSKSLQKNISYAYYYSGHMVYLHIPALKKLHDNVAKFIESTH